MFLQIFKKVWFLWALSLIFNIITLLLIFYKIGGELNKIVVLHFNVIEGVNWYGKAQNLYQIPFGAFIITIINFIFYRFVKNTGMFYAPLSAGVSLVIQLVLLFAAILIIRAN